jgi:hypothetical protein
VTFALLAALLLCSGCSTSGDAAANGSHSTAAANGPALPDGKLPDALVTALDSATLTRMELRTGEWKEGDASSTWNAYSSDGSVRLIDERVTAGENSTRRVEHYFTSDGHLASHIETRNQLVLAGDRPPAREFVLMSINFAGDSATKSHKSVNGEATPIEPFEIDNAKKHADVLLAAALVAPVASTSSKP